MPVDLASLTREVEAGRRARLPGILGGLCPKALAVALFGSRARGDNTPLSDWDLLAIVEDGDYRVESSGVGQVVWLPLSRLRWILDWSMIILDALADAKLLCGDPEALEEARREALRYAKEKRLTRTKAGWIPDPHKP